MISKGRYSMHKEDQTRDYIYEYEKKRASNWLKRGDMHSTTLSEIKRDPEKNFK